MKRSIGQRIYAMAAMPDLAYIPPLFDNDDYRWEWQHTIVRDALEAHNDLRPLPPKPPASPDVQVGQLMEPRAT